MLAHLMPWFAAGSPHSQRTNVAYDSADPWTVASQITLIHRRDQFRAARDEWARLNNIEP